MPESDGEFEQWQKVTRICCCGANNVWMRIWNSDCGGYVDLQFECRTCNHRWWIEGPDA